MSLLGHWHWPRTGRAATLLGQTGIYLSVPLSRRIVAFHGKLYIGAVLIHTQQLLSCCVQAIHCHSLSHHKYQLFNLHALCAKEIYQESPDQASPYNIVWRIDSQNNSAVPPITSCPSEIPAIHPSSQPGRTSEKNGLHVSHCICQGAYKVIVLQDTLAPGCLL